MQINILLWNVWLLPSLLTDGKSKTRASIISKLLNQFDIVILNEAFTNKTALIKDTVHPCVIASERTFYKLLDSGLMILSKYPIENAQFLAFSHLETWDQLSSKGILKASIRLNEHTVIDLYGTHLQAGAEKSHHEARLSQINQIYSFVRKYSITDANPIVLCGDLNCGPVLDPTFEHFSGHYKDKTDAIERDYQYKTLSKSLMLTDLYVENNKEDICRFLYKPNTNSSIKNVVVQNIKLHNDTLQQLTNIKRLSDTEPVLLTFDLT